MVKGKKRLSVTDKFQRSVDKRLEHNRSTRSEVISIVIQIESHIEQTIAWHFCSDEKKHAAFISFLFMDGQITFSQKITILKKIMRSFYNDINSQISSIYNQLDKIRELRNKFAHSQLEIPYPEWITETRTKEALKPLAEGIDFTYFKDGRMVNEFLPLEKIKESIGKAYVLNQVVYRLSEEIRKRSQGYTDENFGKSIEYIVKDYPNLVVNSAKK